MQPWITMGAAYVGFEWIQLGTAFPGVIRVALTSGLGSCAVRLVSGYLVAASDGSVRPKALNRSASLLSAERDICHRRLSSAELSRRLGSTWVASKCPIHGL